jgi:predicted hotdog family 3-hydroxylacyl-ACP dehydratase
VTDGQRYPPLSELLPHAAPSILLDEVLDWSSEHIVARVTIGPGSAWRQQAGVPAHVAIEYMAQACAAWVGLEAHRAGGRPRIGLLLGTREFVATRSWFCDGESLEVSARSVYRDKEMGVFDTRVTLGTEELCRAQLTVVQPDDLGSVLGPDTRAVDG